MMLHAGADRQIAKEWNCLVAELNRLNITYTQEELDRLLSEVDACTYGNDQPDGASLQRTVSVCRELRRQLYRCIPFWKRWTVVYWQEWDFKYEREGKQKISC